MSRFAFHHFLDPAAVLAEMKRVCAPGGTMLLIDAAPARDTADAYNRMEKLRDPSHARALPVGLLSRSFPNPGDPEKIRRTFEAVLAARR